MYKELVGVYETCFFKFYPSKTDLNIYTVFKASKKMVRDLNIFIDRYKKRLVATMVVTRPSFT